MQIAYLLIVGLGVAVGSTAVWAEQRRFMADKGSLSVCRMLVCSLLLAGVFCLLYYHYGISVKGFAYAALAGLLCLAALTDLDRAIIPNILIVLGIAVWVLSAWFMVAPAQGFGLGVSFFSFPGLGFTPVVCDGLTGALTVAGGLLPAAVVYEQCTGRFSLGGGDIKLLSMVSLYLGLVFSLINLFLACILGLIFAPIWRIKVKKRIQHAEDTSDNKWFPKSNSIAKGTKTRQVKTFPFAPAIVAASLFILSFGPWFPL